MTDREFIEWFPTRLDAVIDSLKSAIDAHLHPPIDCVLGEETLVSETPLEACRPDGTQLVAVQWEREIITEPANGGAACGPTSGLREEVRACVYVPPPLPPPTGGEHAYFDALAARPDCFAAYSLRDEAFIAARRNALKTPPQLTYEYPTDPDPRKQDAMKLIIREPDSGMAGTFGVSIGPSHGQSLLFVQDLWFGAEWAYSAVADGGIQDVRLYKEAPISFDAAGIGHWVGMRESFIEATKHAFNQPPGGPYVVFPFSHCIGKGRVVRGYPVSWMSQDAPTQAEEARFPIGAPANVQRDYGNEALCPADAEFGVVPERWHRYWHYFERSPANDWDPGNTSFPGLWNAYRYSIWGADTVRSAVRLMNEVVLGIPASRPTQILSCRMALNAPNGTIVQPGRGDLVQYHRNWIVLHGTSKADVLSLLQQP